MSPVRLHIPQRGVRPERRRHIIGYVIEGGDLELEALTDYLDLVQTTENSLLYSNNSTKIQLFGLIGLENG